jgi:hypothetical protein
MAGLSTLATGQRDDKNLDALADVLGHRRGALARLVVWVRVHGHEAQCTLA